MKIITNKLSSKTGLLVLLLCLALGGSAQTFADTEVISKKPPVRDTTSIKLSHISLREAVRLVCGNLRCRFRNVPEDLLNKETSISLTDVTNEEALQYIAESNDLLLQKISDTLVFQGLESYTHVFRKPPLDENYSASFYEGEMGGASVNNGSGGSGTGQAAPSSGNGSTSPQGGAGSTASGGSQGVTITSSIDKLSFWKDMDENLKKIVSSQGFYTIDRSSSLVYVTDRPSRVKVVRDLLESIDKNINKQVSVDVTIIEVHKGGSTTYGVDWDTMFTALNNQIQFTSTGSFSDPSSPFSIGLKLTGTSGSHATIIKALQKMADVKIIEKTTLLLRNNVAGSISHGTERTYLDSISNTVVNQAVTTTVVKGQVLSGVNIYLLPTIIGDTVTINFMPRITDLESIEVIPIGTGEIQNPIVDIRKNFITVTLKNGETKIVSSVDTDNRGHDDQVVPILSKIPLIGWMFGSKTVTDEQRAIMFIITPTIIEI